jgi:hypothetical protein
MLRPGRWKSPRVRSSACYLWQVFLFHFISTWNDSKQIHAITSWTFTRTQLTQHIIFIFVKKGDVPIPSQKYKEHYVKNTDLYLSWFPLDTLQKNVRIQSPTIKVSNSGYLGLHATTLNLFSYIYIIPVQSSINWESWTLTCAELVPPMEDSEVWVGGIQWVSHWDFFLQPSIQRKSPIIYIIKINHHQITACDTTYSTSTAQGGGGSFKHRKPIGEVGCCESQMAERIHSWTKKLTKLCFQEWLQWLQSPPHHCWM